MPRPSMGAPACGEGCGKIELQKEEVDGIDRGTEKNENEMKNDLRDEETLSWFGGKL